MRARRRPSLQWHLWAWAAGALVVVWLTLAVAAWNSGHHEAREITDGKLVSVARLLLAPSDQPSLNTPENRAMHRLEYALELAVLRWQGERLVEDTHGFAEALGFMAPPPAGLSSVRMTHGPGVGEWRMYVMADTAGGRVAVLVDLEDRQRLGADLAGHVALSVLVVLPLVMLVLWWAIRRGLRPLSRLSEDVARLDTGAGQRLDAGHRFREFASTVEAINHLVDSLQAQARRERAFASDVAHELRTPLASLVLGAAAARQAPTPEALARVEQDALRAGRILQQLLDLARAQRDMVLDAGEGADLGVLAATVAEVHVRQAYETDHELSLQRPDGPVPLPVSATLLELALRNLVDNAIRHTPPGTQVRIEVWSGAASIGVSVSDDGQRPGAFGTTPSDGLGLGLRLVERVAARMGARLETGAAQAPMTTRYALVWIRNI